VEVAIEHLEFEALNEWVDGELIGLGMATSSLLLGS
jgi:uncharacterized protein YgfB (UPF0149 family)